MHGRTLISLAITLSGMLCISCDKEPEPPQIIPPATQPVTEVATTEPATQPVVRENAIFYVTTEGYPNQAITFPPAKLVISMQDDHLQLSFQSDDPPEALKEGYTGNSFRFDFTLAPGQEISGVSYAFKSGQNNEEGDDKDGLFLQGGRQVVRPEEATIKIDGDNDNYTVTLTGRFQLTGENPTETPPQTVNVKAQVTPEVSREKE